MPTETTVTAPETSAPTPTPDEIRAAERQRISECRDAFAWARSLGLAVDDIEKRAFQTDMPIAEVRAAIQRLDATKADAAPTSGAHGVDIVADDQDKRRNAMSDAIAHRIGVNVDLAKSGAREFRGRSLIEIGEDIMRANGARIPAGQLPSERARNVLQYRSGLYSSSDFSHLLLDAMHKQLQAQDPEAAFNTWARLARRSTARDFRTKYAVKFDAFATYRELPEGGNVEYGEASDDRESYAISRYASGFKLTFQAMVNDDLDGFSRFLPELRRGSMRKRNGLVMGLITDNGNLRNGRAVFNTTDATLASSGAAPTRDTIYDAIHAMRSHTKTIDAQSKRLGIQPWAIVAPWALEETIETLYTSLNNPNSGVATDTTPTLLGLQRIYDWDLDDASSTEWYVFADPSAYPGLEYAELEGYGGLTVLQDSTVPDYSGAGFVGVDNFGAGWVERRAAYKNPGA